MSTTGTTIDSVMRAVRDARDEGPEALAATALAYGGMLVRANVHISVLDKRAETAEECITRVERARAAALSARDAAQSALSVAKLAADKDREFLRLARDDAEMFAGQRDAAIARAEQAVQEREGAERERDALTMRLSVALSRPTYEARTTPPTLAQREAHQAAGGAWLVVRIDSNGKIHSDVLSGWSGWQWEERVIFVALGSNRLPCAWPVVPTPEAP